MDKTNNTYGVKDITLKVDGSEVYHAVMDRFSFDNSRSLNSYVDWHEWVDNRQFFMKSYVEPGNLLGVNYVIRSGIISINQEKTYQLEYAVKDAYENTTRFKFTIVGKRAAIPPSNNRKGQFFAHDKYNYHSGNGVFLSIPEWNLYTDIYFNVEEMAAPQLSPYAPVYILRERVPLHSYCPLTLTITHDTFPDKTKYGVVQLLPRGGKHWVGGKYNFGAITAKITELGSYTVQTDVKPPVIKPLEQEKWVAKRRVSFRIMDNLSGIKSYRGTIGGEWVLFEYDAKRNLLYYNHDNTRFATRRLNKIVRQNLVLVVTDGAGNESQFTCEYPILW